MKAQWEEDKQRRKLVKRSEEKRRALKAQSVDIRKSKKERDIAYKELVKLNKNTSKCRVRNRCVISGRSRAVERKYGMARSMLRDYAQQGKLPLQKL